MQFEVQQRQPCAGLLVLVVAIVANPKCSEGRCHLPVIIIPFELTLSHDRSWHHDSGTSSEMLSRGRMGRQGKKAGKDSPMMFGPQKPSHIWPGIKLLDRGLSRCLCFRRKPRRHCEREKTAKMKETKDCGKRNSIFLKCSVVSSYQMWHMHVHCYMWDVAFECIWCLQEPKCLRRREGWYLYKLTSKGWTQCLGRRSPPPRWNDNDRKDMATKSIVKWMSFASLESVQKDLNRSGGLSILRSWCW